MTIRHSCAGLLGAFLLLVVVGCIENTYVPGAPCGNSAGCPPPPEDADDPIPTTPEQCVATGVADEFAFICLPMPVTRPITACPNGDTLPCQTAGFPVETGCVDGTCQCPTPLTTACAPWNPQTCACGGITPPAEREGEGEGP